VNTYTVHTAPSRPPALLAEGFSIWALLFGPVWLLAHRAWIPAALVFAAEILCGLLPGRLEWACAALLAVVCGVLGRDWVRWSLERRGFEVAHVLAARDEDAALARLLAARPDLVARCG
jgi:hypothetical protein